MGALAQPRLHCAVPGCKRTHAPIYDEALGWDREWVCALHWPAVRPRRRRLYALVRRRLKRAVLGGLAPEEVARLLWLSQRFWDRDEAIERALGIG